MTMTSFADMRPEHTLMIIGRLSLGGWGQTRNMVDDNQSVKNVR